MSADEAAILMAEVERICARSDAHDGHKDRAAFDRVTWQQLEHSGFTLVSTPIDHGGGGGSLRAAAAVIRASGRASLAAPLVETMWGAGWLLECAGVSVPSGPLTAAPVESGAMLEPAANGWVFTGELRRVPWASVAELIVGLLATPDGTRIVLLRPDAVAVQPGANLAGEPRNDVLADGLHLAQADVLSPGADVTVAALARRYALGRVLAMSGAAEQVLSLAVRYAGEREQFGRPIDRFQAVQHLLAGLAAETSAMVIAGQAALAALEQGDTDNAGFAISAAKASAGRSAGEIATAAHQVLGALGFTLEHQLHRSTTRLWAWRDEECSERQTHLDVARRVLDSDIWDLLTRGG